MIHKFKFKDQYIVIDVNSGAVHIVSEIVYDILDFYKEDRNKIVAKLSHKYDQAKILEALNEIDSLVKQEMLFTDDSQVPMQILEERNAVIKAMCLHVAHDCNMRCKYCFGDTGAFEGQRSLLSFETGKKAIDFLIKHSGSRRNLEIDFFGGEPLLNFDVVKELVAYGKQVQEDHGKNIRFTITTNGLLLDDEKIDYINSNMVNVILSIDGRPHVNDSMRKTVNGKGTYELIHKNYLNLVNKREGTYYVRGTFTRNNLDFSEDVKHLVDSGFRNVSVEPVVTDPSFDYALKDEDLGTIFKEYERLADLYLDYYKNGKEFDFFHFKVDLSQGPCVIKRVSGCGAGTEYIAVTPNGDIYPCHQFVGNEKFKLGNVEEDVFVNRLYDEFNRANIYNKEECKKCWAKFYCSGGCHANAYHTNNDMFIPYKLGCEMEKKRLECAIGIQAVLHS